MSAFPNSHNKPTNITLSWLIYNLWLSLVQGQLSKMFANLNFPKFFPMFDQSCSHPLFILLAFSGRALHIFLSLFCWLLILHNTFLFFLFSTSLFLYLFFFKLYNIQHTIDCLLYTLWNTSGFAPSRIYVSVFNVSKKYTCLPNSSWSKMQNEGNHYLVHADSKEDVDRTNIMWTSIALTKRQKSADNSYLPLTIPLYSGLSLHSTLHNYVYS